MKPLDEYCSLLPYSEALRRIDAETDPTDRNIVWPEPPSENICALEARYFELAGPPEAKLGQYTSPLLKDGSEQLALLLGLVWGTGFRVFGNWRGVHPAAVSKCDATATFYCTPGKHWVCEPHSKEVNDLPCQQCNDAAVFITIFT